MVTEGNSGVEVREHVDKTGKRPFEGYHADFGHVGIGPEVLGAWDFHFAKREEYYCGRGLSLVINREGLLAIPCDVSGKRTITVSTPRSCSAW